MTVWKTKKYAMFSSVRRKLGLPFGRVMITARIYWLQKK
jgi:hypothetical protein